MNDIAMEIYKIHELEQQIKNKKEELERKQNEVLDKIKKIVGNRSRSVFFFEGDNGKEIFGKNYKKDIMISRCCYANALNIIKDINEKYNIGEYEIIMYHKERFNLEETEAEILLRFE